MTGNGTDAGDIGSILSYALMDTKAPHALYSASLFFSVGCKPFPVRMPLPRFPLLPALLSFPVQIPSLINIYSLNGREKQSGPCECLSGPRIWGEIRE